MRLYHVLVPALATRAQRGLVHVSYVAALPNLMSGETQEVEASMVCGVVNKEVLLLQYENAAGSTFHAIITPVSPRGDAQVLYAPRRLGWLQQGLVLTADPGFECDMRLASKVARDVGASQMLLEDA